MSYQTVYIILTIFIFVILVIAWWLASKCKALEEELKKEKASNKFVVPVAEVKAQFSEEDMKMIRELLKKTKDEVVTLPKADERQCACDHLYGSVFVDQDVKHCCERMIFHCERCNHEEIIPIKRGLLTDTLIRGGF